MGYALDTVFLLCWVAVFVMIIRRGFIDKTFGVPFIAIFVFMGSDAESAFIFPLPAPQVYPEMLFLTADVIIAYQLLRFWRSEFPGLPAARLYTFAGLTLVTTLLLCVATTLQFNDPWNFYSGYAGNFLSAVLFSLMLVGRKDVRGQSFYIALLKAAGTAAASLGITFFPPPGYEHAVLVSALGLTTFVADAVYAVLVYRQCRRQGISPWRRV